MSTESAGTSSGPDVGIGKVVSMGPVSFVSGPKNVPKPVLSIVVPESQVETVSLETRLGPAPSKVSSSSIFSV